MGEQIICIYVILINNLYYLIKLLFYFVLIDKLNHKLENLNSKPLFKLHVLHQKKVFYLFSLLKFGLNEQTDKHRRAVPFSSKEAEWCLWLERRVNGFINPSDYSCVYPIQSVTSDNECFQVGYFVWQWNVFNHSISICVHYHSSIYMPS